MRVIRFEATDSAIYYGVEPAADEKEIKLLDCSGYAKVPTLAVSGRTATLKRLLAPVDAHTIFCIGLNYMKHWEEGAKNRGVPLPTKPACFMKPASALNHPGADIWIPQLEGPGPNNRLDYECELAMVIGTAARNVSEADALKYVAGFTCANDVSARYWQKNAGASQWIKGKGFDTFCPLGPSLVTPDEVADVQNLRIRTIVNGETRQDSNTSDMIFSCAQIVAWLSADMTLLPGTVIITGTPSGVGAYWPQPDGTPGTFLKAGDSVTIAIEGLGELTNGVVVPPVGGAIEAASKPDVTGTSTTVTHPDGTTITCVTK